MHLSREALWLKTFTAVSRKALHPTALNTPPSATESLERNTKYCFMYYSYTKIIPNNTDKTVAILAFLSYFWFTGHLHTTYQDENICCSYPCVPMNFFGSQDTDIQCIGTRIYVLSLETGLYRYVCNIATSMVLTF
jgi:hypothetical protein